MVHSAKSCAIGIGSNLTVMTFNPIDIIKASIIALDNMGIEVEAVSNFYQTPSFPKGSGPDFVNACLVIRSVLAPDALLEKLHFCEGQMSRKREQRWGARTLDLDLLFYGNTITPNLKTFERWRALPLEDQMVLAPQDLILPHPRLHERSFVLAPLMDICPTWQHPVLGLSVAELYSRLEPKELFDMKRL